MARPWAGWPGANSAAAWACRAFSRCWRSTVPASFFVPAVSALIDPDEPRRIVAAGHEVGIHGWIHENNSLLPYETERDLMLRARDTLARLSGQDPQGLRSANWDTSPNTVAIVKEMGCSTTAR